MAWILAAVKMKVQSKSKGTEICQLIGQFNLDYSQHFNSFNQLICICICIKAIIPFSFASLLSP